MQPSNQVVPQPNPSPVPVQLPAANPAVATPPSAQPKSKLTQAFKNLGPAGKVFAIGMIFVGLVLLLLLLIGVTGLDKQFFSLGAVGTITSSDGQPIPGATVKIEGIGEAVTNNSGQYSISNVREGTYQIMVDASGYEAYFGEVQVASSFLNYLSVFDFNLKKSGLGSISGQLVSPDPNYVFINDLLLLDGNAVILDPEGTFELIDIETGLHTISLESNSFFDIEKQFELNSGQNPKLADIVLEPAGDMTGNLKSYIREDLVLDLEILVEGVSSSNIEILDNGDFSVKDLEIGRTYTVRTRKEGYQSRDYNVPISQGDNPIEGFRVVEAGLLPFVAKDEDNDNQVFVSTFDGEERRQLTTGRTTNPFAEYIKGDIIYYLSDRDRVRSEFGGGRALLAYAVSTEGGNAQRITTNSANLGAIYPNFSALKLANVTIGDDKEELNRKLEVMDLQGESRLEMEYIEQGTFDDVKISDNGAYVYYYMQDKNDSINGLYRANVQTGVSTKLVDHPNTLIYDVTHDGDRVLYSASNQDSELVELRLFTVSTGQDTRILQNVSGYAQFQFIGTSKSDVIFQAFKDGANNVYRLDVETNDQEKLTRFSGTEGIEAVYQQAGYVIYQTNKGMYVMDPDKPVHGVLVTREFARYTGYDF